MLFENDDLTLVNIDFDFWKVKIYGSQEHVIHPSLCLGYKYSAFSFYGNN